MRNDGDKPVRIREVILLDIPHDMPGDTKIYGEGFTHLSATVGTIAQPVDLGSYMDRGHYKLAPADGAATVYGMLLLSPAGQERVLLGFSTCLRYCGKLHLRSDSVQAVLEMEDIAIDPGEVWHLEDFVARSGKNRADLLGEFADRLAEHHRADCMPDLPPTGWCSWYCFGSQVTAENVRSNLDYISKHVPELKYILIDDGYQSAMGDWLETGDLFGGGIREVIKEIRERGFEPAIWVAPFVAQEDSKLFREHPDWFVKDEEHSSEEQYLAETRARFDHIGRLVKQMGGSGVDEMKRILSAHAETGSICRHSPSGDRTAFSWIADVSKRLFLIAPGPPCSTPWAEYEMT